jgi:hypothetical protein
MKDCNKRNTGFKKRAAELIKAEEILTRDYLLEEFINKEKSLRDIVDQSGCLPNYVFQKIVAFNLLKKGGRGKTLIKELLSLEPSNVGKAKPKKLKPGHLLTKGYLHTAYNLNKRSLGEIAKECGCSRTFVYRRLKSYGIPQRDKTTARTLALTKGKLMFERTDEDGQTHSVTLQKNIYNECFFSKWSDKMAYVLGVICTDGSLFPNKDKDSLKKSKTSISRFTVFQKEPELLEKILSLMECNAKLLYNKKTEYESGVAGEGYFFHINNEKIYDDLIVLGITPRKSLTLKFPEIPPPYVRHFIRGCWDGDGSFHYETKSGRFGASFVSGSLEFIKSMLAELYKAELPKRTIHKHTTSAVYYFKFYGSQCKQLYHYLYDSVPASQYLTRKHDLIERFTLEQGKSKLTPQQKEVKWRDIYNKYYPKIDEVKWRDIYNKYFAKKDVSHED